MKHCTADPGVDCGNPNPEDPMWFTQVDCSISSVDNFTYLDDSGIPRTSRKGELIKYHCDDVFCPIPPVPDCYEMQNACTERQFCWIDQHEKWGPWAMGQQGISLDPGNCGASNLRAIVDANIGNASKEALLASYTHHSCASGIALNPENIEAWKPIHGQCVGYRQLEQSCYSNPLAFADPALNPAFHRQENGKVFLRPLVCDPAGGPGGSKLVCTGPDFEVLPSTCVHARPPNTCLSGPWWYSLDCPRTAPGAPKAGLSRKAVIDVAATMMLLFPGEVSIASSCPFWDVATPQGRATEAARKRMYAILAALWPVDERVTGKAPSFNEIMAVLPNKAILANVSGCYINQNDPVSDQAKELIELGHMMMQPNKVWSGIHFLIHNQPNVWTPERVAASKAAAAFLLENFWCDDCRGFFYGGIISTYGMPPDGNDAEAHAKWWWWGHNVASEHVASVRGGHPWIHQLGAADVAQYQQPFFMAWEDAVAMWKVPLAP